MTFTPAGHGGSRSKWSGLCDVPEQWLAGSGSHSGQDGMVRGVGTSCARCRTGLVRLGKVVHGLTPINRGTGESGSWCSWRT